MCTALIIFALTQDKLIIDIDKSTFDLIISILNRNENENSYKEYLNDLGLKQAEHSSGSLPNSPTSNQIGDFQMDDNNDEFVYKKIYSKCRKLFDDLNNFDSSFSNNNLKNINFNSQLLSLDCLLNLNQNMKKNLLINDYYKDELRKMRVLDKILMRIKHIISNLTNKSAHEISNQLYLLNKLKSCLNLLETLTQSTSNSHNHPSSSKKSVKAIKYNENWNTEKNIDKLPVYILNQNYLIEYEQSYLIDLVKE